MPPFKINPVAWLASKFTKSINNNLSYSDKQSEWKSFARQTFLNYQRMPLDKFIYLDRAPYNRDFKRYIQAVNSVNDVEDGNRVAILLPAFGEFEDRNGHKLLWIFGVIGIGAIILLISLISIPLKPEALEMDLKEQRKNEWAVLKTWTKGLIIPQKKHFGTQVLLQINFLVFLIMVFTGLGFIAFDSADLLRWGANFKPDVVFSHQYWRLITNIFLHGGVMHLLLNMYGLFFVGIFLEPVIGTKRYVIIYLITGIAASITSVMWHPATVSVGASGAIFGVYGVFFALLIVNVFPPDIKRSFLLTTTLFIVINLIYGLTGGIDNAAHIGGLISGLIIGYIIHPIIKQEAYNKDEQDDGHELTTEQEHPD